MSKKTFRAVIIFIIVAVLALAVFIASAIGSEWFSNKDIRTWFNYWGQSVEDTDDGANEAFAVSDTGKLLRDGGSYNMPASMTVISTKNKQYGGDCEITLVASLSGALNFACYFENPVSEWANDKTASDFVVLKNVVGKDNQVKLTVKSAFGEPIILKAAVEGSSLFEACKINFLQQLNLQSNRISLGGNDITDEANIEAGIEYEIGTVKGSASVESAYLSLDCGFIDRVNEYLNFNVIFQGYSYDIENSKSKVFDDYIVIADGNLRYSMFIKDFNEFTQPQKDAIYDAWYKAYSGLNVYIDIFFRYEYQGNLICKLGESDILGGTITGYTYGYEVDINLKS